MRKDMYDLMLEFEQKGYIEPECPDCEEEMNPTEIDAGQAYCEVCEDFKKIIPVI